MGNCLDTCIISCCISEKVIEDLERYSYDGRILYAKVCEIYDGDTCSIVFRTGMKMKKMRVRCYGYDSPEMRPSLSIAEPYRAQIKQKAENAKKRFTELTSTTKYMVCRCGKFDKYGRLLVVFYEPQMCCVDYNDFGKSINAIMIREDHGVPYYGGTKVPV